MNDHRLDSGPYPPTEWRGRVHEIIFEADTTAGKIFDIGLLIAIVTSIAVILLESVKPIRDEWGWLLDAVSLTITVLFTVEYILRILSIKRPLKYVFSFLGIIDVLAIVPGYFILLVNGPSYLAVLRALRLLRVFHVFKMGPYVAETNILLQAIRATKAKIVVFLMVVVTVVLILGTAIYVVENPHPDVPHPDNKFTSIPVSVY